MKVARLVYEIIQVAEKAARLARAIRSESALFSLLVEEKTGKARNKRFVQDFKTLADVLVQEMLCHHLATQFPGIEENIRGEESNTFTNTLGDSVCVRIQPSPTDTQRLLTRVLDGNESAARILATLIHEPCSQPTPSKLAAVHVDIPLERLGIWIDPIDSTAQYISGTDTVAGASGVHTEGLQCVVLLIGVYDTSTGQPIAGVINQPFCRLSDSVWHGRTVWGLSCCDVTVNDIPSIPTGSKQPSHSNHATSVSADQRWRDQHQSNDKKQTIIMSTSEAATTQACLRRHFDLVFAAGAGYKILCVIDGLVDAYFLSGGTTFKWDTCGPQALLRTLGGGMVDYTKLRAHFKHSAKLAQPETTVTKQLEHAQIVYHQPDKSDGEEGQQWSNRGGLIAYRFTDIVEQILKIC